MAAPRPEAEQRLAESEALARELDELEVAMAELKAHYEQYFLGVDRQPPLKADAAVRQRLSRLRAGGQLRGGAHKFRAQSLQQRFTTYDRLWQRTLNEMENGTYQRDLAKARRRRKTGETPVQEAKAQAPEAPPPVVAAPAPAKVASPPTPVPTGTQGGVPKAPLPPIPAGTQGGAARPSPVPQVAPITIPIGTQSGVRRSLSASPTGAQASVPQAAAAALAEPRLRAVYEAYIAARKSCQEDVSRLSYESVADSLRKQVPELLERHGAKDVEYKVVVKDGKAILRAVPKT